MLHIRSHFRSTLLLGSLFLFALFATNVISADDPGAEKPAVKKPAAEKEAPPAKDSVEGTLVIKGVTYKLTHVLIYEAKFFDEMRTTVLASSKPIPLDELNESLKKDGTDDGVFLFEPHVKLSFDDEGKLAFIFAWADNNNISKSGGDDLKGEIKNKEGRVTGNASLKSEEDSFIKCDFNLKFEGNLMKAPKIEGKPEAKSSKSGSSSKKKSSSSIFDLFGGGSNAKPKSESDDEEEEMKEEEDEDDDDKPVKKSSAKSLNVYDLPLPKDAEEVEYKKLVEHIGYKSATSVEDLADFLVKGLKKQGWKSENDTDLITANSAILNRELGDATLTIFVNADGEGSKVTIMTEGLSWDKKKAKSEKDATKTTGKKSAPAESEDEESEKEE